MLTSGRVEIEATAADVWPWLVEPVKLAAWLGSSAGMPDDPAELHAGWSTTTTGTPAGDVHLEITAYEPPTQLSYRSTYTGGDAVSTYRLTEAEGTTTVVLEGDTDWGRPQGGLDASVDSALAGQSEDVRDLVETQLEALEDGLQRGAFDAIAQPQLQQAVDVALQKLKSLVETAKS